MTLREFDPTAAPEVPVPELDALIFDWQPGFTPEDIEMSFEASK